MTLRECLEWAETLRVAQIEHRKACHLCRRDIDFCEEAERLYQARVEIGQEISRLDMEMAEAAQSRGY